jgi:hypothetical protein
MKTYKQFMSEALPLLAAPALAKTAGAIMTGAGAAGLLMKATKQGQGGRSQPTDYGQGGTAKPRTKNVQRPSGKMTAADAQKRQAALDRKAEAKLRVKDKNDVQHGPSFEKDAAEAARRREQNLKTPDQRLDDLVGKAAKNLGIKLP